MEMERFYYVITAKTSYHEFLRAQSEPGAEMDQPEQTVVAITQGGFGQDVVDEERQVKERYLEHLFTSSGIDLARSFEVFDKYFTLQTADFIDLDEDI